MCTILIVNLILFLITFIVIMYNSTVWYPTSIFYLHWWKHFFVCLFVLLNLLLVQTYSVFIYSLASSWWCLFIFIFRFSFCTFRLMLSVQCLFFAFSFKNIAKHFAFVVFFFFFGLLLLSSYTIASRISGILSLLPLRLLVYPT